VQSLVARVKQCGVGPVEGSWLGGGLSTADMVNTESLRQRVRAGVGRKAHTSESLAFGMRLCSEIGLWVGTAGLMLRPGQRSRDVQ
jgi:hypothetical protein